MKPEMSNKFSELSRRVKVTSKARYNASRRLNLQHLMSQWTLAFLSVALILISLVSSSDIAVAYSDSYIDIMQIVFAVLILAYSLLLGTGDCSARAVKVHRCGMELGRLARKVKPYEEKEDHDEQYSIFLNEYYNCLEKYENHEKVDYLVATFESEKVQAFGKDYRVYIDRLAVRSSKRVEILFWNILPISHYVISISGVSFWLYLMVQHNA